MESSFVYFGVLEEDRSGKISEKTMATRRAPNILGPQCGDWVRNAGTT